MQTYIKNDLNQSYLILESNACHQEDYQTIMLRENDIPGILKTDIRNLDNQSYYYYDISGKISLQACYEQGMMRYAEMKQLVEDLLLAIKNLENYMLDGNGILLDPKLIFSDRSRYYFCYYPFSEEPAKEAFHKLTEFFVMKADERDEKGIRFAYTFHKGTMDAHYSIEEILRRIEPGVENVVEVKKEFYFPEEVVLEEAESDLQDAKESVGLWNKIRTFLEEVFIKDDEDEDL